MIYNYRESKKRIDVILNDSNDIKEVERIPSDSEFTYENGYFGWVTALFVDIRHSTSLFANNKKSSTAKIVRCFTSEIIDILKDDSNYREIGIRGDCVYAIYATPKKDDVVSIFLKARCINTFMNMLNRTLKEKFMRTIDAGIGISTNQDLVVKTGRKQSGLNNKVWIGKSVTYASKLSNIANSIYDRNHILMTPNFRKNIMPFLEKVYGKNAADLLHKSSDSIVGEYYGCNLLDVDFNSWISRGMRDE